MHWISINDVQLNLAAISRVVYRIQDGTLFATIYYIGEPDDTTIINGDSAARLRAAIASLIDG